MSDNPASQCSSRAGLIEAMAKADQSRRPGPIPWDMREPTTRIAILRRMELRLRDIEAHGGGCVVVPLAWTEKMQDGGMSAPSPYARTKKMDGAMTDGPTAVPDGTRVADVCPLDWRWEYHGRVLAAAPELLALLERCRTKLYNAAIITGTIEPYATMSVSEIDELLAKIEGKEPAP